MHQTKLFNTIGLQQSSGKLFINFQSEFSSSRHTIAPKPITHLVVSVAIDGDGGNGGGEQQHKNSNAISFLPPSAPNHITMHATNDNQQQTNKQSTFYM
jgi:hypothetical protein